MTWIVMGFCIGIGLILAWVALCVAVACWKEVLFIVGCLFVLALSLLAQSNDRPPHPIHHVANPDFNGDLFGLCVLGVFFCGVAVYYYYNPPQWVQNLSAAYHKRTGGKI
jgi:hypothetical protein